MHCDFTDLRLFVRTCDAGSITGGADRVHLTLASASERIRNLEADLGTPLLTRTRLGVQPTLAGRAFLQHARELLAQFERMRGELGSFGRGSRGQVRMLCNTAGLIEHLPEVLSRFLAGEPGISVELEERPSRAIADALNDGACDIGVLSDAVDLAGLEVFEICPDPLVLVVPHGHRFARCKAVALIDAVDDPFVGHLPGSALDEHVAAQARRLGRRLEYRVRISGFEAMCRLVGADIGIGVAPARAARRYLRSSRIRCIPLTDPWAARRLMVGTKSLDRLPEYAQRLVTLLRPQA